MEEIIILDGFERMDFNKVTDLLANEFWSPGISIEEVKKGAQNSALVLGAFINPQTQVGYARVISDKTRFAYILDVVVDPGYRKRGIGQKMINSILTHSQMKDVYQWLLITRDAHGVHSKLGFNPVSRPLDWMEIRHERPKR